MSYLPTFNNVSFRTVNRDGEPWITAPDLAAALGYRKPDAVSQLFDRNSDEFTPMMTAVVLLPKAGETPDPQIEGLAVRTFGHTETRIFSLRGAHLVAMFAKTPIAAEFRRWVLDVLEHWKDPPPLIATPIAQPAMMDMDPVRINSAVALVREGRRLFGPRTARELWIRCGLPVCHDEAIANHIEDDLAEPVREWLIGRIAVTAQEVAQGIGIPEPDSRMRQRIAGVLRAYGWVSKAARLHGVKSNAWFAPTNQPWHGVVAERVAA